jgi:hypothetical protein
MPKAILLVHTNPSSPDADEQFNKWYTDRHIHDIVGLRGFASATRYELSDVRALEDAPPSPHRYLAIYEVDADAIEDLAELPGIIAAGVQDGSVPLDDSLGEDVVVAFYVPIDGATTETQ